MSIMLDEYHSDKKVWLAGLKEGAKREQARIIEWLVEKDKPNRKPCSHSNGGELPCGCCNVFLEPNQVISFIEGETNE